MLFSMTPVTFVFCILFSQALPAFSYAIAGRGDGGVIAGLLQHHSGSSRRAIEARQSGTCDLGYHVCTGFEGCCPTGTNCGVWGGKPGCCPIGQNCIANDDPCIYQGDLPCENYDFCCPAGDTCYRDSAGNAKCSSLGTTSIYETGTSATTRPALTTSKTPTTTTQFNTPTQQTTVVTQTTAPSITVRPTTSTTGGFTFPTVSINNPLSNSATSSASGSIVFFMMTAGLAANLILL